MNPLLHFVYNPKSGHGEGRHIFQQARNLARENSWQIIEHAIDDPKNIESIMREAAEAAAVDQGTLAVSGGDGTLRAAVQALRGRPVRFAVVPGGTFNLFARTHGIPEDPSAALNLIFHGTTQTVRVGELNGHVFLINANVGLYAQAIHERKTQTQRWGRHRWVAILSTFASLLKGHPNMQAQLRVDTQLLKMKTPMIFIGNNSLQLKKLALKAAEPLAEKNLLAVFTMKPFKPWDMLRLLFRGLTKNMDQDSTLKSFNVSSLDIDVPAKYSLLCLDGEMYRISPPYHVRALPDSLHLVKAPATEASAPP